MVYNFYIDPIRRTVTPESMTVLWLDQDVTTIHFSVEDFDGFTFDGASVLIKVVLPDRTQVEITPDNFTTEPITTEDDEGQTVITGYSTSFDWTLTLEHTKAVGLLTYSICAIMLNLDGETVDKEWHTLNDSFQIRDHIHFNGSDDQDDPVTAATNAEKIAALKARVDGLAGGAKTAGAVSQMTDHSVAYVYTGSETGYTRGAWYYWNGSAWVSGGTYGGAVTDTTLSVAGAAADAKAVGDAMAGIGAASVPTEVRQAMLTLFQKAAYIEEGLADEVAVITAWAEATTSITVSPATVSVSSASPTAQLSAVTTPAGGAVTWASSNTAVATVSSAGLVTAVGNGTATITATSGSMSASCAVTVTGFVTLTGIEATYTQSGTVYDTASLDDLKDDLVVTGTYDDSSTATITDYTLSGTLTEGTSTITVSYGGFTDTFDVTVTEYVTPPLYSWDFRNSNLTDSIEGLVAATNASQGTDGITFNAANQYIALNTSTTLSLLGKRVEIDVESMSDAAQSLAGHGRTFGVTTNNTYATNTNTDCWIRKSSGGLYAYSSSWSSEVLSTSDYNGSYFSGKTIVLTFDDTGKMTVSVDGTNLITYSTLFTRTGYLVLGGSNSDQFYRVAPTISAVRIYAGE